MPSYLSALLASPPFDYLGHIIAGPRVATDLAKVQSMVTWPTPKNVSELRSILGLTGYYRKFIQHYGSISKPLIDLPKKDAFQWVEQAQGAFETLKKAMATAHALALPNFSQPFVIETNANCYGMGVVLMQQKHPIAYISKALGPRNKSLSAYEKELLAITFVVSKLRHYLEQG